jgi:MFS family permease
MLVVLAAPLVGRRCVRPASALPGRPRRAAAGGFWLACAGILLAVLALGITEGVLPLHVAGQLQQAQLGAVYVGVALLVACSAAVAGAAGAVWLFVLALALAGIGIGAAETGATGVLLQTVAPERIVTAMVLWSQVGIVGYLAGPLLGGIVAEAFGFQAIGAVPLVISVMLLAAFQAASRDRSAR